MAIRTVGELRAALKGKSGSLPIAALDRGSDTGRPFQVYKMTKVSEGSVGSGNNPPATVFVEVVPK